MSLSISSPPVSSFCFFCRPDYLSVFDCESAHLSLYHPLSPSRHPASPSSICLCVRPRSQPPRRSTYTRHTVDTTNLAIISAQIISFLFAGAAEAEREWEIRVMGSITPPVSYINVSGNRLKEFYWYLTLIKTSSSCTESDNFRKSGTACWRELFSMQCCIQ